MNPVRSKSLSIISILLLTVVLAVGNRCQAVLYTLDVGGTLLSVDTATGSTTPVIENLAAGSWSGLTGSPTDDNLLYALHNPRPPTFDDPQFARLVELNLEAGTSVLHPFFDAEELGAEVFATAVAISPENPDIAVVVGTDREIPPNAYIWDVDVSTGDLLEPAESLNDVSRIESLTFGLDGTTLFATNPQGELVTLDRETLDLTVVGDPGLSNFLTGIAFRPSDGQLFAVNALRDDELVTLDADGGLLEQIGRMGINGPEGLAFAGADPLPLDCDADGMVNAMDLDCANAADITDQLLDELGLLAGDFDGNKEVNFEDFVVLAGNFSRMRDKYTEGDIDDNGEVNFADFVIFAGNFGREPGMAAGALAVAVPEPTSSHCYLVPLAGLLLSLRRTTRSGSQ